MPLHPLLAGDGLVVSPAEGDVWDMDGTAHALSMPGVGPRP